MNLGLTFQGYVTQLFNSVPSVIPGAKNDDIDKVRKILEDFKKDNYGGALTSSTDGIRGLIDMEISKYTLAVPVPPMTIRERNAKLGQILFLINQYLPGMQSRYVFSPEYSGGAKNIIDYLEQKRTQIQKLL